MSKIKVYVFNDDTQSFKLEKYVQVLENHLETKNGLYALEDVKRYFNESDGYTYYFIMVDMPARIEVENLRKLRRSAVINNLFNYDIKKGLSLSALMPYLIIIALILFN